MLTYTFVKKVFECRGECTFTLKSFLVAEVLLLGSPKIF
jgi:hypothetical protein